MLRAALHGAMASSLTRVAQATALPSLFSPISPFALATRTMKVMQPLKKRCDHCYIVKRGKLRFVYCKVNPRHKARNGPKVRAGWLHKRPNA